jgi:hypothetical protein
MASAIADMKSAANTAAVEMTQNQLDIAKQIAGQDRELIGPVLIALAQNRQTVWMNNNKK